MSEETGVAVHGVDVLKNEQDDEGLWPEEEDIYVRDAAAGDWAGTVWIWEVVPAAPMAD